MFAEHISNQDTDPSEPDNDRALYLRWCNRGRRFALLQLNTLGHIMANTSENRCDRQANRGGRLPERSGFCTDQLSCTGSRQNDQRCFRRAGHQQACFRRSPRSCTSDFQKAACNKRFYKDYAGYSCR